MTDTLTFAQNSGQDATLGVSVLVFAFAVVLLIGVGRVWSHTYSAEQRLRMVIAHLEDLNDEAHRNTEAVQNCHRVLYSIWAAGYQGEAGADNASRAPSRQQIPAPSTGGG